MQVKTSVKAGDGKRIISNHNEARVRPAARGLKVQSGVKAGGMSMQHNETPVRPASPGLKVRSGIKAGFHFVATMSKASPKL